MNLWSVLIVLVTVLSLSLGDESLNYNFGCDGNFHLTDAVRLLTDTFNLKSISESKFVFAVLISPEISSYVVNSLIVNAIYFEKNNVSVRVLSDLTGDDYYPPDRRWNKIKAIPNALIGWASSCEYVVFIDADLMILSNTFNLNDIVNNNSHADLILSADSLDAANTGFMIVRNSQWSVDFFSRWWNARHTTNTFCDQHVFNRLVAELKEQKPCDSVSCVSEFDHHISILEHKALNSKWPAIEHFSTHDNILHLMGETRATRDAVMKYAAQVVCETRGKHLTEQKALGVGENTEMVYPHQFGLTRSILRALASSALIEDIHEKLSACREMSATNSDFEGLHATVSHLCVDITKYSDSNEVSSVNRVDDALSICLSMLQEAYIIHQYHLSVESIATSKKLFHLNQMTMLLFDTMRYTSQSDEKETIARKVLGLLGTISSTVDLSEEANRIYIHHKRGIVYGARSEHFQSLEMWAKSLEIEQIAASEFHTVLEIVQQMESDTNTAHPDTHSFMLEHIYSSLRLSVSYQHLHDLSNAVEWSRTAVINGRILFAEYSADQRLIDGEMNRLIAQHVSVCSELGRTEEVEEYLKLLV